MRITPTDEAWKDNQFVIDGERIFLKKRSTGWRQIYPFKINGEYNWKNILIGGTWANLRNIAIVVSLVLILLFAYQNDAQQFNDLRENPCDFVEIAMANCMASEDNWLGEINFGEVKLNG